MSTPQTKEVGYVYSFNANVGDGATFTITGNLPLSASATEMKREVSRAEEIVLYLRAKFELPVMEGMLAAAAAKLADQQMVVTQLTGSKKAADQNHLVRAQAAVDATIKDMQTGQARIDEARARIAAGQ